MHISRKYLYLAGFIGMAWLPAAFAEPGVAPGQDKVGHGHDYIVKTGDNSKLYIAMGWFTPDKSSINITEQNTDYTLQINTNWSNSYTDAPCPTSAALGCIYREEFVYDTNYNQPGPDYGESGIYIRYWMKSVSDTFPFRAGACSANGWTAFAKDNTLCFRDSVFYRFDKRPIKALQSQALPLVAETDADDSADYLMVTDKTFSATPPAGIPKLASYWHKVEFNIFGADGGSALAFEPGTSLTANVFIRADSSKIQCEEDTSGTVATKTAANNLNLDPDTCVMKPGHKSIRTFQESY